MSSSSSGRNSGIDAISDTLMAKAEGNSPPTAKRRPTSPPEGDTPCKKQALLAPGILPETATPIFNISMFGAAAHQLQLQAAAAAAAAAASSRTHEYTADPSETESRASSKSPLEAVLDSLGLTKPLAINIQGPSSSSSLLHSLALPSCSGPPTALTVSSLLTHDDSPSDSESDDIAGGSAAAAAAPRAAAAAAAAADDQLLPAGDSLSPFLQSVLAGTARASDDDIFCTVPGRLSLLSQASKYSVTVGEIRRRLGNPESLNASLLGGILRRAKSKNGGKMLRDAIQAVGMELPVGRRKSIRISLLTSLVEGEAAQLGRDFNSLCYSEFPVQEMAAAAAAAKKASDDDAKQRRLQQIDAAKELANEFLSFAAKGAHREDIALEEGLQHFELATHNFGLQAITTGLQTFARFLEQQRVQLGAAPAAAPLLELSQVLQPQQQQPAAATTPSAFTQVAYSTYETTTATSSSDSCTSSTSSSSAAAAAIVPSSQTQSLLTLSAPSQTLVEQMETKLEPAAAGAAAAATVLHAPIAIRPVKIEIPSEMQQQQAAPVLTPSLQDQISNMSALLSNPQNLLAALLRMQQHR